MKQVEVFTDGSSLGNPGPGGYGCVLRFVDARGGVHERELAQGFRRTTNNRMELLAAIAGLEALREPCRVTLYSDSQYLVRAFKERWIPGWIRRGWVNSQKKPVKNPDLWQRLLRAAEPHEVEWVWVKGHAGHAENERCDELAKSAAAGKDLAADAGYESGAVG